MSNPAYAGSANDGKPTAQELTPEQKIEILTWRLFVKGCIDHSADLEQWADKQINMKKADIKKIKGFSGLWKNLGYPVPDKLKNMWGMLGIPVFIYQHEHGGCTVTSTAAISPEMLKTYLKAVGDKAEKEAKMPSKLEEKRDESNNVSTLLLSLATPAQQGEGKAYLLARSIKNKEVKTKTTLHYFFAADNLKM